MARPNDVAEARNRAAPKTILPGRPRKRRDVPARRASTSRQPAHCCGRRRRVRCGSADRRAFNARSRGTGFHIIILARSVRAQDKSRSQQRVGTCRVFSFPLIVRSERTLRRPAPQALPPESGTWTFHHALGKLRARRGRRPFGGAAVDDKDELLRLAAKCRRIANSLGDGRARASLLELASDYERRGKDSELPDEPGPVTRSTP